MAQNRVNPTARLLVWARSTVAGVCWSQNGCQSRRMLAAPILIALVLLPLQQVHAQADVVLPTGANAFITIGDGLIDGASVTDGRFVRAVG